MIKITKIVFSLLSIVLLMYLYEVNVRQPKMVWMGMPKLQNTKDDNWVRIFRNKAYLLAYSEKKRNALWVSYKAIKQPKPSLYTKRPKSYKTDWRSTSRVNSKAFNKTGFDRGHLAPNYLIGSRYGRAAQLETFLMSNISPQRPNLNRKLWQRLEELISGYFLKKSGDLWVMTGPIFDRQNAVYLKHTQILIPNSFYKILIRPNDDLNQVETLSFVMPQKVKGNESLTQFVTTIDDIETLTGLDFFSGLPNGGENRLEALIDIDNWNLEDVADRPSRY